jgi:uncharacterized membrane protein YidH (DUF202 family)
MPAQPGSVLAQAVDQSITAAKEGDMKAFGILLVVIGLVALVYGGVSWTRRDTVVDAGPIEITTDKKEGIAIPPLAGIVAVVAGIAIIATRGKG